MAEEDGKQERTRALAGLARFLIPKFQRQGVAPNTPIHVRTALDWSFAKVLIPESLRQGYPANTAVPVSMTVEWTERILRLKDMGIEWAERGIEIKSLTVETAP